MTAGQESWFDIESFTDSLRGVTAVDLHFGPGRVLTLGELLDRMGGRRALVIGGKGTLSNGALRSRLDEALGGRWVGTYSGVTPRKRVESVFACIERMSEVGADTILGVGGGSSMDIARQASAFAGDGRSLDELVETARIGAVGSISSRGGAWPVMLLPTTLAGADVSAGGSIEVLSAGESPDGQPRRVHGRVSPELVVLDARVIALTPLSALRGSLMNGVNKALEALYAVDRFPPGEAWASFGLRLAVDQLQRPRWNDVAWLEHLVVGVVLGSLYRRSSIIHAFAHALARHTPVQQGAYHAVTGPAMMRYLGKRGVLPVDRLAPVLLPGRSADQVDDEQLAAVFAGICDGLGYPSRLSKIVDLDGGAIEAIATYACSDPLMRRSPLPSPLKSYEAMTVLRSMM